MSHQHYIIITWQSHIQRIHARCFIVHWAVYQHKENERERTERNKNVYTTITSMPMFTKLWHIKFSPKLVAMFGLVQTKSILKWKVLLQTTHITISKVLKHLKSVYQSFEHLQMLYIHFKIINRREIGVYDSDNSCFELVKSSLQNLTPDNFTTRDKAHVTDSCF